MNFIKIFDNITCFYREYILREKIKQYKEYISFLEKDNLSLQENLNKKEELIKTLNEMNNKIQNCRNNIPPKLVYDNIPDNVKCPVCLSNKCNTAFICTHVVCSECSEKLSSCPICRKTNIRKKFYFNI